MIKILNSIPTTLLEYGRLWQNVLLLINTLYDYYFQKIKSMRVLYDSGETPVADELIYMMGTYINKHDTNRTAKSKLVDSVYVHQHVNVFESVWKPIIDDILGGNSYIYRGLQYYGSFVVGQSIVGSPSVMGYVPFLAGVTSSKLAGEIFIDLDVHPSSDQTERLIGELKPLSTVYFNIYLGTTKIMDSSNFSVGLSIIGDIDLIGIDTNPMSIFEVNFIL